MFDLRNSMSMQSTLEKSIQSLPIKTNWRCYLYQLHFIIDTNLYDFIINDYLPRQLQKFWQAKGLIDLKIMDSQVNHEMLITWTWETEEDFASAYHSSFWRDFQEDINTWSDQDSIRSLSKVQNTFTIIE